MLNRLLNNGVKNHLLDACLCKATAPVLAQGRGIRHLIRQTQAQKPPIGHINFNLPHQLPLRTHAKQVANEQHLEQHHRINRRAAIVSAIQVRRLLTDKIKADVGVNQPQQVILRN